MGSSWDRARNIPWERIPKETGPSTQFNLDHAKERIFRELSREAAAEELKLKQQQQETSSDGSAALDNRNNDGSLTTDTNNANGNGTKKEVKIPYSNTELLRQAAFGGTLGSITGALFGFMDSMKTAGESPVLQKASNMAKGRYLVQGTTRSAFLFGVFFSSFQSMKYGFRIALNDPGEVQEIVLSAPIALGALFYKPAYRPAMPYACMLIGMDCFSMYMKKTA